MDKRKIIQIAQIINIIVAVCFAPIMLFVSMFALSDVVDRGDLMSPIVVMTIGYLMVIGFGLFSFKKNKLLFLSIVGWSLVWWGNHLDKTEAQEGDNVACVLLRQDPQCFEETEGTIQCKSGEFSGVYPGICSGIPK